MENNYLKHKKKKNQQCRISVYIKVFFFFSIPQEPEWDESSAFFTNAASHIRPKGSSRKSKENKENEARREVNKRDWKFRSSVIRTAVPKSVVWKSGLWSAEASLRVYVFFVAFDSAALKLERRVISYCYTNNLYQNINCCI